MKKCQKSQVWFYIINDEENNIKICFKSHVFIFVIIILGDFFATPRCAQGWLVSLYSRIILGRVQGNLAMSEIKHSWPPASQVPYLAKDKPETRALLSLDWLNI